MKPRSALIGVAAVLFTANAIGMEDPRRWSGLPGGDLGSGFPILDYSHEVVLATSKYPHWKPSEWVDRESRLANFRLRNSPCDVLIPPFQPQGKSFDIVERSLMARFLADRVSLAGKAVPDPGLVEAALGYGHRLYDRDRGHELATSLGCKSILWGYAGYADAYDAVFTVRHQSINSKTKADSSSVLSHKTWENVAFSDELLPSVAFQRVIPEVLGLAGITNTPIDGLKTARDLVDIRLPDDPRKLVESAKQSIVHQISYLQFLGAMVSSETGRLSKTFFERSLVALTHLPEDDPRARRLRARAYLGLDRRPAALSALGKPINHEENAILGALNSNLPALREHAIQSESQIGGLIDRFTLTAFEKLYGESVSSEYLESDIERLTAWAVPIERVMLKRFTWKSQHNLHIKLAMDRAYPVQGVDAESFIKGHYANNTEPKIFDFAELVETHYQQFIEQHAQEPCCPDSTWAVRGDDYLSVLREGSIENSLDHMVLELYTRGRKKTALRLVRRYSEVYPNHPTITHYRAEAEQQLSLTASSVKRGGHYRAFFRHAFNALIWSGGQTYAASHSNVKLYSGFTGLREWQRPIKEEIFPEDLRKRVADTFDNDFPRRSNWPRYADSLGYEHMVSTMRARYRYAMSSVQPARFLHSALQSIDKPGAESVITELENRFIGSPHRIQFLADLYDGRGERDSATKVYRDAVALKPVSSTMYNTLAKRLVYGHEFDDAAVVARTYPGFDPSVGAEPVHVRNFAFDVGSYFFWRGQHEYAREFFALNPQLKPGSYGDLGSRARVALIDQDWSTAMDYFLRRAKRYEIWASYGDYIKLLHAVGEDETARALFATIKDKYRYAMLWESALVGHRINGTTRNDYLSWLDENRPRRSTEYDNSLRAQHAMVALAMDRPPSDDLKDIVSSYEQHGVSPDRVEEVTGHEWTYKATQYARVASAYNALRTGDYKLAFRLFAKLASRRPPWFRHKDHSNAVLPYFARAAVKLNIDLLSSQYARHFQFRSQEFYLPNEASFDHHLSHAFFSGGAADYDAALESLKRALGRRAENDDRLFPTYFQLIEAAEWLYEDSKDNRFKALALQWATRYQVIRPVEAWAYAVEARFTQVKARRIRALGFALFLDKKSERLEGFSESERREARQWFKKNNPWKFPSVSNSPQA